MTLRTLTAGVDIQAAAGEKPRKVRIVAYAGGEVTGAWRHPFVAEYSGMKIPNPVTLLYQHANDLGAVLGGGTATIQGRELVVAGTITSPNKAAADVLALLDSGSPLQSSIGLEIIESTIYQPGKTATANGQTFKAGPNGLEVITKSRLREVSIVALGADSGTSVISAALSAKGSSMQTLEAFAADIGATITDTNRAQLTAAFDKIHPPAEVPCTTPELERILGRDCAPLLRRAMTEGWTHSEAMTQAKHYLKASLHPSAGIDNTHRQTFITGSSRPAPTSDHLAASLMVKAGYSAAAEKSFGAATMEQSKSLHAASFIDICRAALIADARDVPHSRNDLMRQAISTGSLPVALGSSADKIMAEAWRETPATWRTYCGIKTVPNLREQTGLKPTFGGALKQLAPAGKIKHGTMKETTFAYQAKTFAKMYSVDREHIINDDLSVFAEIVPGLGQAAVRTLSDLVYTTLLANAGSFFHANNANLVSGGSTALDATSLGVAVRKLRIQTAPGGLDATETSHCLDLRPHCLLVPPELEVTARALLQSAEVSRIATGDNLPTGNVFSGLANLEIEPRLSNSTFTGYSTTAWYLFARPADAPQVVAFLDGNQNPTIEQFGLDHDVDTLAVSYRVYHDFGSALGDFRAAQKSAGA